MRFRRMLTFACLVLGGTALLAGGCSKNNNNGGTTGLPTSGTVTVTPGPATLTVPWHLSGPGGFEVDGTDAATYRNKSLGDYTLTWGAIDGWVRPAPPSVTYTLEPGETIDFAGTYRENLPSTITVDVTPDGVGIPWALYGPEDFRRAGTEDATFEGLDSGVYIIEWQALEGWWQPSSPADTVSAFGGTTTLSGVYREDLPAPEGFVFVPDGTFTMGSPADEWGRHDDETQHEVVLSHEIFALANELSASRFLDMFLWAYSQGYVAVDTIYREEYPAPGETLTVYDRVEVRDTFDGSDVQILNTGASPVVYSNTLHRFVLGIDSSSDDATVGAKPMTGLNWYGAAAICDWFSLREGLPRAYDHEAWTVNGDDPYGAAGYRLPTEAEWEYLCRAGSTTAFCDGPLLNPVCGDPNLGLVGWSCLPTIMKIRLKAPNDWGFYDMHGNAAEWCLDAYGPYAAAVDTLDPFHDGTEAATRVVRGGQFSDYAVDCRSAKRSRYDATLGAISISLRPVRTIQTD